jgi:hypothetical protein
LILPHFLMQLKSIFILLSGRTLSILVMLFAATSRLITQLYYFSYTGDRSSQLVATKNFIHGHGITLNRVFFENFPKEFFIPLVGWPLGYTILLSPLAFVTNGNVVLAAIIFDLVTVLIFILYSRKILLLLNLPVSIVNLFTIVTGLFLYDFCLVPGTDLNALAFFVCAIYMSLNFLKNDKKNSGYAVQIAAINFLCPFLRYMFIPISLIIPLYLLFIGIKTSDNRIRKGGMVALIVTITLLCGLLIFQQTYTGQATYLPPDLKGFFPSNLLRWYPIVTSAFTNVWFYYSLAELAGVLHYGQYFEVIWGINILLFALLLYLLARFYQKKKWSHLSLTDHYVYIGSAASLTIMALLIALSLRNAPLGKGFSRWTYLLEPRYMSFIVVFLQQLVFIFIFTHWKQIKNNVLRFTGIVIAILLSLEVIHGSYITSKIILSNKEYFHPPMKYLKQMEFIKYLIHQFKKESPSYDIIFVSANINYCNAACLENAKTICGFEMPDNIPATLKHSILIAVVEDEEKNKFTWFVNNPSVRIIKTIDNVNFYEYRTDK